MLFPLLLLAQNAARLGNGRLRLGRDLHLGSHVANAHNEVHDLADRLHAVCASEPSISITIDRKLHLDTDFIIGQVHAVVNRRRHVVADVDQAQQRIRLLQNIDQLRRQQGRGNLVVVADHHPASAHLAQLRSVLQSDLVSHVLLTISSGSWVHEIVVCGVHRLVVALSAQREDEGLQRLRLHRNIDRLRVSSAGDEDHNIVDGGDEVEEQGKEILTLLQLGLSCTTGHYLQVEQHSAAVLAARAEQSILVEALPHEQSVVAANTNSGEVLLQQRAVLIQPSP